MTGPMPTPDLRNLEGHDDFDIVWPWNEQPLTPGMTTVLRVKNEARTLPWALPPLFAATQHVILVDNQSDDGTVDVARTVAAQHGAADRLTVHRYPFRVSRCGPEHLATPERSVHSLAYFYNWSFSHVRTTYSLKWDGDMILTREGVTILNDLSWQLASLEAIVRLPRHPLFVESERVAYLDLGWLNMEEYGFPMGEAYPHVKAFEWEMRLAPEDVEVLRLPQGLVLEVKFLDADEFTHWTSPEAFATSGRTQRKRREWEVFTTLNQGGWEELAGVRRIEAPEGVHVIDHITDQWLPRAQRPIVQDVRAQQSGASRP